MRYDRIGTGYVQQRRPDPRLAALIWDALGDADSIVNVGAGAGSYEPRDRRVVAVEPAITMIRQRTAGATPVVRAFGVSSRRGEPLMAFTVITLAVDAGATVSPDAGPRSQGHPEVRPTGRPTHDAHHGRLPVAPSFSPHVGSNGT